MNASEFESIVNAWVNAQNAPEDSDVYVANEWAIDKLIDWSAANPKPDLVWQFVLAAYRRDISEHVFGMIAAGPLEDLLSVAGSDYIERVETLAATDARFRELLRGVWRQGMTDDIWARVQFARAEPN